MARTRYFIRDASGKIVLTTWDADDAEYHSRTGYHVTAITKAE